MTGLSQNAKAKAKLSREKICGHCDKQLESQAFWTYFTKLRGNTVTCVYCTQDNYVAMPDNTGGKIVAFILALIMGIIVGTALIIGVTAATYNEITGTVSIYWWVVIAGFFFMAATTRFVFRIWQWRKGFISIDKMHKDYGEF